ncbi:lysine-2,3-aminomutase-like protein [Rhizobium halophytocola]|uniref:Lysine 2,3-aminomutase n=1 Tax=Rhizobium halophytocola TaxID=735519 RepID=A0ABS4E278_9HYPH|nr:lysine-2,3-aminomutase-like protein [Rhizobium halophytocola]MBP1852038.1 lysine 2,3-aminomutase [Rhizobium halophytocola]
MTGRNLKSVDDLIAAELLPENARERLSAVGRRYAVALTPTVADLIDRNDPADPIARQFLPSPEELQLTPDELGDPIGDGAHTPVPGIVHRYPDRVLLKVIGVCPVYCRFCFRREMVGPDGDGNLTRAQIENAMDYIRHTPGIWEVILTGGDPLVMSPRRLREVADLLAGIDHVKILRLHSRVPAVDPEKIDQAMIEALKASGKTIYLALHANHPLEITPAVRAACARLADAGVTLVSQSVLLKGVNDDAAVLGALMRAFVEARVKPYYLHHPDMAPGTSHFRLTIAEGQAIMRTLRATVSGLCLPAYILDLPGGHGKVALGEDNVRALADGRYEIRDRAGDPRLYP